MSILFEVNVLKKEVEAGNFDLSDKILNIRTLLLSEDTKNRFSSKEAKTVALRTWNITVKLHRLIHMANDSDKSTILLSLIPSIRILTVDIYQKYIEKNNEDDEFKLFYFISYTYKSLLDADNDSLARKYNEMAIKLYTHLKPSSDSALTFVHLKIWQAQHEISQNNNYNGALMILKEFTNSFSIISSNLISYIYEKTIETKSIEWCKYCFSLANNSTAISDEMKSQIESLLAQLYLNNSLPEEAMKIISHLPKSINQEFLELKCLILLFPNEPSLKERLINFISKTSEDRRLLVTLCLFVAENCNRINEIAIEFITEALKSTKTIPQIELRKHIYYSSIRISSEQNNIDASSLFLKMIKSTEENYENNTLNDEDKKEIAGLLWNKALDNFYNNEFEAAIQWMQLSRSQTSDIDTGAQSSCLRFISRCYHKAKKYTDALSFATKAVQAQPKCAHGYFLKFNILIETGNETEAFELINNLIQNSPHLEEFEPSFFTSISYELHSRGNDNLALEVLLKFYQLNFNSIIGGVHNVFNSVSFSTFNYSTNEDQEKSIENIKKSTINSIFALLQVSDDIECVSNAINILSSRWKNQISYTIISHQQNQNQQSTEFDNNETDLIFTCDEISAYAAIAFNNGLELKKMSKFEKAIQSFLSGSVFSEKVIECKAPCIFEAIDCYINLIKSSENGHSSLSQAQSLIDRIATEIESTPNIDQKYKDGLSLARIKINLIQSTQSDEFYHYSIELIEDITLPAILCEVCDFIIEHNAPREVIQALLERAKIIDQLNKKSTFGDNFITSISASLLQQLVSHSETLEERRKTYDLVMDFISPENASLMSTSQLQFFMSHAWNIGVNCAKSFRVEDANWWLKTALNIMNLNEELKSLYADELNDKYSRFIQKNTIFSSTLI